MVSLLHRATIKYIWSALLHRATIKQQYIVHTSYGERRLTNGSDRLASFGHPSTFQQVSGLGFVTAPTSLNGGQTHLARFLAVSWGWYTIYTFWGLLSPNEILPGAKFTLRSSLALSYWQRYCTTATSGRQPNIAAWYFHAVGQSNCLVLSVLAFNCIAHFFRLLLWRAGEMT